MHTFTRITQNEFDPLKTWLPYRSVPELAINQIPITYGLNDNYIEGLHPLNFLNII